MAPHAILGFPHVRILSLPYRLWKRLHPFTWLVMLVVAVALVIIVVPGMSPSELRSDTTYLVQAEDLLVQLPSAPKIQSFVVKRVHGWPRPWAATSEDVATASYQPSLYPTPSSRTPVWCWPTAWPCFASHIRFDWRNLLVDLLVAIAVIVVFGAIAESWFRRRGGLLRFRIVDMLVAITCLAILLGWYQYHVRLHRDEVALASKITGVDWGAAFDPHAGRRTSSLESERVIETDFGYTGPDWLARLAGDERVFPALRHRISARVFVTADWRDDVGELEAWPFLREVEFSSILPRLAVPMLDRLPRLEALTIRTREEMTHEYMLGRYNLRDDGGLVGPHDYSDLARLRLARLTLENRELTAEDIEGIANNLPTLRSLVLIEPLATPDEIEILRERYPRLTFIAEWPIPQPPAINPASPLTSKQQVDLLKRRRAKALKKQAEEANSAL